METKEKKKKVKIYTYHVSHSFYYPNEKQNINMLTQLYQIGVYAIINNDPKMQISFDPIEMVKLEKKLNKDFDSGKITNLEYGREISVYEDEDGFWKEKIEENEN